MRTPVPAKRPPRLEVRTWTHRPDGPEGQAPRRAECRGRGVFSRREGEIMGAKIINCKCSHKAQDAMHGAGNRVCNLTTKGKVADMAVWRCTVCGAEHTRGRA